jgi:2'-5' RNA ligase
MNKENLYFVALIPKKGLREKITAFKSDFAKRFRSSKALNVYPHITLKAPFKYPANRHQRVIDWFQNLRLNQFTFTVKLKNFGAFQNKYSPVVFVNPVKTQGLLSMQEEIIKDFETFLPSGIHPVDLDFSPHITVAYRDLSPEMFSKAWEEYKDKSFDEKFEVDAFYLLQHDTKKWNLIATDNLN